jgi:hypothetical protein
MRVDLVNQFGELDIGFVLLLKVKVNAVVESFEDHLLAAHPGEEDERDGGILRLHDLQELDPVHGRHIIIGHNDIEGLLFQERQRRFRRQGRRNRYRAILGEIGPRKVKEHRFVIDQQDPDNCLHPPRTGTGTVYPHTFRPSDCRGAAGQEGPHR